MYETKTTEWHNELKPTEIELKRKTCLLTLYLNHFNENKLMFGRTLNNFFNYYYFFCGIVKLICELWHAFFYKSTSLTNLNSVILQLFALFLKTSAFCGWQNCLFCHLQQHLCSSHFVVVQHMTKFQKFLRSLSVHDFATTSFYMKSSS